MGKENKVTNRERVYNFLVDYIMKNGFAPSVREISTGTGLHSTSTVYNHLKMLEMMGKSEMKRGYSPKAIKLVGFQFVKVEG